MAFPQKTQSFAITQTYAVRKTLEKLCFNTNTPVTYMKPLVKKAELIRAIRGKYRHITITSQNFIEQKHREALED